MEKNAFANTRVEETKLHELLIYEFKMMPQHLMVFQFFSRVQIDAEQIIDNLGFSGSNDYKYLWPAH